LAHRIMETKKFHNQWSERLRTRRDGGADSV
jgi:hypothetical protein